MERAASPGQMPIGASILTAAKLVGTCQRKITQQMLVRYNGQRPRQIEYVNDSFLVNEQLDKARVRIELPSQAKVNQAQRARGDPEIGSDTRRKNSQQADFTSSRSALPTELKLLVRRSGWGVSPDRARTKGRRSRPRQECLENGLNEG